MLVAAVSFKQQLLLCACILLGVAAVSVSAQYTTRTQAVARVFGTSAVPTASGLVTFVQWTNATSNTTGYLVTFNFQGLTPDMNHSCHIHVVCRLID
jgi:hypothetical protein